MAAAESEPAEGRDDLRSPVPPGERDPALDVLRGIALLGILVVNMAFFMAPAERVVLAEPWWPGTRDRIAEGAIRVLAQGKFFALFSFLFGAGFAIQASRAEARGGPFAPLYLRRLTLLLAVGLAHSVLLWYGDILTLYALLGFVLLLFRARPSHTLLAWGLAFLTVPLVLHIGLLGLMELARSMPDVAEEIAAGASEAEAALRGDARRALEVYGAGSFAEVVGQRVRDLRLVWNGYLWGGMLLQVFGYFLLGAYAFRTGILTDRDGNLPLYRKGLRWGLPLGLGLNLAAFLLLDGVSTVAPTVRTTSGTIAFLAGAPLLFAAYTSGILLLLRGHAWDRRLRFFAPVGRAALSNYVLQSLVCTTLFYGYGFGLYSRIGPAGGLVLTGCLFAGQVVLSGWWMRRFRFGPLEWAWRCATYGTRLPLRRTNVSLAEPGSGP